MMLHFGHDGQAESALHVHAGFPIKAAQDMYHLFDLKPIGHDKAGSPTSAG